jgi:hypothetical protein
VWQTGRLERGQSKAQNPDIDNCPLQLYKQDMISHPFLIMPEPVLFDFASDSLPY